MREITLPLILSLFMGIILLFGCTKNPAPPCNAAQTVNEITNGTKTALGTLMEANYAKQSAIDQFNNDVKFSLEEVQTIHFYKKSGDYACSANFVISKAGQAEVIPIRFTSAWDKKSKDKSIVQIENSKQFLVDLFKSTAKFYLQDDAKPIEETVKRVEKQGEFLKKY